MEVYYSQKSMDCQIPDNILSNVTSTFSTFSVETDIDGTVTIKVPASEKMAAEKFRDDVYALLKELRKENDVLAGKLARHYRFKLPKSI